MIKLSPGKLNIIIDGQFGSTGKGLLSNYVSIDNHIDIAISNASSNAGHTAYDSLRHFTNDEKIVVKHLPISGLINHRSAIYLCAGSIIDVDILQREIEEYNLDTNRLIVHPRAAVIENSDILSESMNDGVKQIASTMSGVGSALVRKINRKAVLANEHPFLKQFVKVLDVHSLLDDGCTALMEVPQGMDLGLNHGFSYPYCTSRDITISSALNDANVHPSYLGKVCVSIRTFPIRVGNVFENGIEIGNSGPFYPDSIETSWEQIGVKEEYTTRTNRIRRVSSFSMTQYRKMLDMFRPDYILLNFCNYLNQEELALLLEKLKEVTHLGFSPRQSDIVMI